MPDWVTDRGLFALAVMLYGLGTLFALLVWRRDFRQDNLSLYGLLALGWVSHTLSMLARGFSLNRCPITNLFEAILFILWAIGLAFLAIGFSHRLRFLGVFIAPLFFCVGVFALVPELDKPAGASGMGHLLESLHAAFILLAYGGFGLGALTAVMYLIQERNLKVHKKRAITALLPPMMRLERVTAHLLAAGVFFLTGGLITGHIYLNMTQGTWWSTDPFVLYSFFTWILYAALLAGRWWFAQRGRRLAFGAVGSFAFIMLTFWGIFLLSGLHNRPSPVEDPPSQVRTGLVESWLVV